MNSKTRKQFALLTVLAIFSKIELAHNAYASEILAPEAISEEIDEVLSQRHPKDNPDWWRGLGEHAPSVIIKKIKETTNTYHRLRLLQALGNFYTPEVKEFLRDQAEKNSDDLTRTAALTGLARSGGESEIETIAKYLKSSDPHVRAGVISALRLIESDRAEEVIRKHRSSEQAPWVMAKIDKKPTPLPSRLPVVSSSDDFEVSSWMDEWNGLFVSFAESKPNVSKNETSLATIPVRFKVEKSSSEKSGYKAISFKKGYTIKVEKITAVSMVLEFKLDPKSSAYTFEITKVPGQSDRIKSEARPILGSTAFFLGFRVKSSQ